MKYLHITIIELNKRKCVLEKLSTFFNDLYNTYITAIWIQGYICGLIHPKKLEISQSYF